MVLLFLAGEADSAAGRVAEVLSGQGYVVRRVHRLAEAEHLLHTAGVDALIASGDALEDDVLLRIRRDRPSQSIIGWLERPSAERTAALLEAGAREVVSAAMGDRELVARVAAALRSTVHESSVTVYGPLAIDGETGEATWDGNDLPLTRRERQVLQTLAAAAGRTVRRDRLYREVWGYAMARGDRSVDVNVKRLRAKLAKSAGGRIEITTQPGVGYRLELRDIASATPAEHDVVTSL